MVESHVTGRMEFGRLPWFRLSVVENAYGSAWSKHNRSSRETSDLTAFFFGGF